MADPENTRLQRTLEHFSELCSFIVVVFGLVTLSGWALHLQRLKSFLPGQVTVKANTAVCFVLIGVALWLVRRPEMSTNYRRKLAAQILAFIVSLVGLLSLLEGWRDWNVGIDQLLFHAGPEDIPGSIRPGLMSPITAMGFCLLGTAVMLLHSRARWVQALLQSLCSVVALVSIFGLLNFILDPARTHGYISPFTGLALILFSLAVVFSRSEYYLGALFASSGLGGELARRLLPVAFIVPLLIGWLRWKGEYSGIYSEWTGVAIMTIACVTLLATATIWTALLVERIDQQRRQVAESVERLAAVVTSSNHAIISKTLDGIVTNWNAGAETIYGYSAAEMVGRSVTVVVPPDRLDEFRAIMQRVARGEIVEQYETVRLRKGGQTIDVSISVSALKDQSGKIIGACTIAHDISERKRAEEQVRKASLYARSLLEASLDPLVTIDVDGRITDVNEATEKATGMSRGRLIGSDFSNYFTEPEKARHGYRSVFESGFVRDYPLALRHVSGRVMHVLYNATVFRDEAGEVEGVFAAARDVTERKLAEEQVRQASLYARSLLEASPDPLVTISKDGKIMDVNQATELATGVRRDQLIGSDFCGYFTEPDTARRGYERVFAEERVRDYPLAIRHVLGGIMEVLYNATLFRDEAGQVEGVFAAARDITERKRTQEAIATERQRFRDVLDRLPVYVVLLTPDYHVALDNSVFRERFGESQGRPCYQFLFHRDSPCEICETYNVLKTGQPHQWKWTGPDGRDYDIFDFPFTDSDGSPLILEMGMDVTQRKRAERALNLSEKRHRSLVRATTQIVWMTDATGEVVDDMPLWRAFTGMNVEQIQGSGWINALHPDDRQRTAAVWAKAVKECSLYDTEYRIRRHDGEYRDVSVRGVPVLESDGSIREWIGTCTDITERKRAEGEVFRLNQELEQRVLQRTAELQAANKELEAFTYSVSHDLRAPLRHISGFSKILSEEFGPKLPIDAQHHLQRIDDGTRRMGLLVDDLLNLAHVGRRDITLQVTGLNSVVQEVIASLATDVGDRQIEWKVGDLPYVECDTALMKQVFQNLLANAVKFTRPRTKAVIEIGQMEKDGIPVVYVRDNGVGFSMKYADKLFGVFQRLHRSEDFEGTGVGLATVQRIIQKHGGRIWAEAELDKGASFYFTIGGARSNELKANAAVSGVTT